MKLEEEVDDRVSHSLVEIYMDEGKSGWEECVIVAFSRPESTEVYSKKPESKIR
ncbi:MAG: hypothetical protein LBL07_07010 [Tannerella sp.]|jgi:L-alanine-DL-glutamate epimerase-like enolase superfamily enzyme|nr:hypothetical protein [Tannerella sp.]